MKKSILLLILGLSSLFAQQKFVYIDLYGEIQMNTILANKCLEEIAYTRKVDGNQCKTYEKVLPNTDVYSRLLKRDFRYFNSKDTHWVKEDWIILKNQMKKLIYTSDLIKQFK